MFITMMNLQNSTDDQFKKEFTETKFVFLVKNSLFVPSEKRVRFNRHEQMVFIIDALLQRTLTSLIHQLLFNNCLKYTWCIHRQSQYQSNKRFVENVLVIIVSRHFQNVLKYFFTEVRKYSGEHTFFAETTSSIKHKMTFNLFQAIFKHWHF